MAIPLRTTKITIPPNTAQTVSVFNDNRKYLLIGCSTISSTDIYVVLYNLNENNITVPKSDALNLSQGGYYEPTIIPSNEISIINISAFTATAFLIEG